MVLCDLYFLFLSAATQTIAPFFSLEQWLMTLSGSIHIPLNFFPLYPSSPSYCRPDVILGDHSFLVVIQMFCSCLLLGSQGRTHPYCHLLDQDQTQTASLAFWVKLFPDILFYVSVKLLFHSKTITFKNKVINRLK